MVDVGSSGIRAIPRRRGRLGLGIVLALLVVILDQLTKNFVLGQFAPGETVKPETSFFNFVLVGNRGVSFGMFNDDGGGNATIFTIIALVISAVLLVWLMRTWRTLLAVGIGFVIGGAIGNVIDRLRLGSVVDFLDFHAGDYHWPAFNVADAAICLGVFLMLIDGFRDRPARQRQDTRDPADEGLPVEEDVVPMAAEMSRKDRRALGSAVVSPDMPQTGLLLKPGRPMRTDVWIPAAAPPFSAPPASSANPAPGPGSKHLTPARPTTAGGPHGA